MVEGRGGERGRGRGEGREREGRGEREGEGREGGEETYEKDCKSTCQFENCPHSNLTNQLW